jgi:hypothetical protein
MGFRVVGYKLADVSGGNSKSKLAAWFLLGLIVNLKDSRSMFLRNVGELYRTTLCHILEHTTNVSVNVVLQ